MIGRVAFVGLALAGLTASAAAAPSLFGRDPSGAEAAIPAEVTGSGDDAAAAPAAPRHKQVRKAPVRIGVLPPLRPAFAETAADAALADPLIVSSLPTEIVVTVPDVPPPSFGVAAVAVPAPPATEIEADRPRGKAVAVLPPLRPAIEATSPGATDAVPDMVAAEPEAAMPAAPVGRIVRLLPPPRPVFRSDESVLASAPPASEVPAEPPRSLFGSLFSAPVAAATAIAPAMIGAGERVLGAGRSALNSLIALHARENAVPEDLVHRVVIRESKYNPKAVGQGGALGLMQIKHATARALGYTGTASGLLDADTNLTYAVKYLAGAYRTANGDRDQAVRYYARGYYYAAKARTARYASSRRDHARGQREADASTARGTSDAGQ